MPDYPIDESPWLGDALQRKQVALDLSQYLTTHYDGKPDERGFVLAVNADCGYGKTFLLERWVADLQSAGYPAVYFDAWKNDFTPEPLIAFMAEIQKSLARCLPATERIYPIFV